MSRKRTLESYNGVMLDRRESFDKCCWDVSVDKISLKDRPHVIDFIESITGLKTLCGRDTRDLYRLLWVEDSYINGQNAGSRREIDAYFKVNLEKRGYKLTKIDFNIGVL